MKKVAVVMGSKSDWPVMKEACLILDSMGVPFHQAVISAHRSPDKMIGFARSLKEEGYGVVIAGAGGAAHLPGMFAALTTLPVIGVPIKSKSLDGLDSLLSIVQMPPGVPVATMGIDNAKNAALYAISILALSDDNLYKQLEQFRQDQARKSSDNQSLSLD